MYTSLQWIARTDPCRCSVVFFGTFPRRTLSATPKGLTVHTRQPPIDSRFLLFFLSYSKLMPLSLSEYVRSSIHPFSGMVVSKKKKKECQKRYGLWPCGSPSATIAEMDRISPLSWMILSRTF